MIVSMSREAGRSCGALIGLAVGFFLMWLGGYHGLWAAFCFGAGGAVAGGMAGERWIDAQGRKAGRVPNPSSGSEDDAR